MSCHMPHTLWCRINGIIAGFQEIERAREGVALLMKDECFSDVIEFGCVRCRTLGVKFKLSTTFLTSAIYFRTGS